MIHSLIKLGLIVCFVTVIVVACSDSPTDPNKPDDPIQHTTWVTTWGGPEFDMANRALTVEGGVIVVGDSRDAACAVKFDAETGNPVWELVLGSALPESMKDIAATPDGGAVLAGYIGWLDALAYLDTYFMKISGAGEVLWEGKYGGYHGKSHAYCVAVSSDGTPYIAGLSRDNLIVDSMLVRPVDYIIKLNPVSGEVVKELAIDSLIDGGVARDMIAVDSPEPGLVFVGYRHLEPLISKISEDLDRVIWDKTPAVEDVVLYEVVGTHDGSGYVAVGDVDGFKKACLIGFDLEGNTIWSNVIAYSDSGRFDARGVAALSDGYLVAGLCQRFDGDKADIYLVKTDLHGDVVSDTAYGWPDSADVAMDVDTAPNGGGYVAARTFYTGSSGYQSDFYVIRTDPNGLQR